jgi:diaminohydroxyphosphoribosylaminopyrimidine deaminase/5-amino-6-(5-phosphoribosylamino)uracil reductase
MASQCPESDVKFASDNEVMRHALQLARQGFGTVEPNPQVGAVIVSPQGEWIAEGYHQVFGGPHAEIHAIQNAASRTHGQDLFVTLEPCSHFGKTPPCVQAVLAAGFRRVVVGCQDPAPHVAGQGLQQLRDAGVEVLVGVCEHEATALIAPFRKHVLQQRPWLHAKWAMTLDGRVAARSGHSKWISCEQSRAVVHALRGRVEAIITGAGTLLQDDPLLTARPPGPRVPLRVLIDSHGTALRPQCQLLRTLPDAPVLVCVAQCCTAEQQAFLEGLGVEVLRTDGVDCVQIEQVLQELGRRRMTHVLLESGPRLMGAFFDQGLIDEVHVFVAPKIVGGDAALSPIGGLGLAQIPRDLSLSAITHRTCGSDILIEGQLRHGDSN